MKPGNAQTQQDSISTGRSGESCEFESGNSELRTRNSEQIAIAVVQHQGRYLIGPRPVGKPLAGKWEFPGGKIQPGETPEAAAARECLEETGIEVLVAAPFPEIFHQYDHAAVQLHFFSCAPLAPDQTPREPFRWVNGEKLGGYEFPEANAVILEFLVGRNSIDY